MNGTGSLGRRTPPKVLLSWITWTGPVYVPVRRPTSAPGHGAGLGADAGRLGGAARRGRQGGRDLRRLERLLATEVPARSGAHRFPRGVPAPVKRRLARLDHAVRRLVHPPRLTFSVGADAVGWLAHYAAGTRPVHPWPDGRRRLRGHPRRRGGPRGARPRARPRRGGAGPARHLLPDPGPAARRPARQASRARPRGRLPRHRPFRPGGVRQGRRAARRRLAGRRQPGGLPEPALRLPAHPRRPDRRGVPVRQLAPGDAPGAAGAAGGAAARSARSWSGTGSSSSRSPCPPTSTCSTRATTGGRCGSVKGQVALDPGGQGLGCWAPTSSPRAAPTAALPLIEELAADDQVWTGTAGELAAFLAARPRTGDALRPWSEATKRPEPRPRRRNLPVLAT